MVVFTYELFNTINVQNKVKIIMHAIAGLIKKEPKPSKLKSLHFPFHSSVPIPFPSFP